MAVDKERAIATQLSGMREARGLNPFCVSQCDCRLSTHNQRRRIRRMQEQKRVQLDEQVVAEEEGAKARLRVRNQYSGNSRTWDDEDEECESVGFDEQQPAGHLLGVAHMHNATAASAAAGIDSNGSQLSEMLALLRHLSSQGVSQAAQRPGAPATGACGGHLDSHSDLAYLQRTMELQHVANADPQIRALAGVALQHVAALRAGAGASTAPQRADVAAQNAADSWAYAREMAAAAAGAPGLGANGQPSTEKFAAWSQAMPELGEDPYLRLINTLMRPATQANTWAANAAAAVPEVAREAHEWAHLAATGAAPTLLPRVPLTGEAARNQLHTFRCASPAEGRSGASGERSTSLSSDSDREQHAGKRQAGAVRSPGSSSATLATDKMAAVQALARVKAEGDAEAAAPHSRQSTSSIQLPLSAGADQGQECHGGVSAPHKASPSAETSSRPSLMQMLMSPSLLQLLRHEAETLLSSGADDSTGALLHFMPALLELLASMQRAAEPKPVSGGATSLASSMQGGSGAEANPVSEGMAPLRAAMLQASAQQMMAAGPTAALAAEGEKGRNAAERESPAVEMPAVVRPVAMAPAKLLQDVQGALAAWNTSNEQREKGAAAAEPPHGSLPMELPFTHPGAMDAQQLVRSTFRNPPPPTSLRPPFVFICKCHG